MLSAYAQEAFNVVRKVNIDGVVRNPGVYELKRNMNIKDLIIEVGGVSEDVFRYMVEIARIDPFNENYEKFAEIIKLEMDNDYSFHSHDNLKFSEIEDGINKHINLMPYDYVSIRLDPSFELQKKVIVEGLVYYPGSYVITNPDENIVDIINRVGGLRPNAYAFASSIIRNDQIISIDLEFLMRKPSSKKY